MGREITLAGFRLTFDEWTALDGDTRAELLREFAVHRGAAVPRDAREGYRLLEAAAPDTGA